MGSWPRLKFACEELPGEGSVPILEARVCLMGDLSLLSEARFALICCIFNLLTGVFSGCIRLLDGPATGEGAPKIGEMAESGVKSWRFLFGVSKKPLEGNPCVSVTLRR